MDAGDNVYPKTAPRMPQEFWTELADENPLGATAITPQDAEDWFLLKCWTKFKTYPYGRTPAGEALGRHILRWWARIDGQEILDARHLRAVREGRAKPRRYRTRPGTYEMPQEPRTIGEAQKVARVRLVSGE